MRTLARWLTAEASLAKMATALRATRSHRTETLIRQILAGKPS